MRSLLRIVLAGATVPVMANLALGQPPIPGSEPGTQVTQALPDGKSADRSNMPDLGQGRAEFKSLRRQHLVAQNNSRVEEVPLPPPEGQEKNTAEELAVLEQKIDSLRKEQQAAQAAPQDDQTKKKFDLLQKQIETLEKMVRLLADQAKKQPPSGAAVDKLQEDVARQEARSRQAAQRDKEVASAIDNIVEHADAQERNGPLLPATLKELFLPSQTNETPVSIWTNLVVGYNSPETGTAGPFFGNFSPHLRVTLNDWIYAIGEIDVFSNGAVDVSDAEADFIINDWLTVVIGRFPAPIGFFNERLNSPWINKLPDIPLLFRQVSPPISVNGALVRGAHYLGDLPVKIAYAAYASSGLELNNQAPVLNDVANLENMENTYSVVSSEPTLGGRMSLWYPAIGVEVGLSYLHNADYTPVAEDGIQLWELDANYHKGNWDLRFEYAELYQHAASFIGANIRRRGLYAQVAYRPLDSLNCYLQKLELVGRYSYTSFSGIDPTALDLTTFATPVDVPVNRHQYTIGINYWFYSSLVAQVAYEFNQEPGFPLNDNIFMAQLGWGF